MRDVYSVIATGGAAGAATPAFATFEDGYRATCIVDAILESHRRGGAWTNVRVPQMAREA
jgi:hypothetical protein